MDALVRKHFFEHGKATIKEQQICHFCQIRSFSTYKTTPISIVNETKDGAVLPPKFRFIEQSVYADNVELAEESFHSGCQCTAGEDCKYGNCLCLQDMAPPSDEEDGYGVGDGDRKEIAYHTKGAKAGLLRSKNLGSREPIYECHSACNCSIYCPNRVVERGRTIPLQIFRTDDGRGWGVRTTVKIRKGQFVDKYVGEVITNEEAERRRAESQDAKRKDVYLFALDKFYHPESPDLRLRELPLEVDGEFMSGPSRFINHSCDPNMRIFARVGDHVDKHVHDLALFAIKDISAGEELTFDYIDGAVDLHEEAHKGAKDMTPCRCGSVKCRKWLW